MDFNVWATIRPINATAKGHKENESMVIAATRVSAETDVEMTISLSPVACLFGPHRSHKHAKFSF